MNRFLTGPTHKFHAASKRLQLLLNGPSHDIFAVDVFYHRSCYMQFAVRNAREVKCREEIERENRRNDALHTFIFKVRTKIVRDECAFLLHELLEDIKFCLVLI